jgi:hypothetical protein
MAKYYFLFAKSELLLRHVNSSLKKARNCMYYH